MDKNLKLLTGSEAAVMGALAAGATVMYGYPITPATEILQGWINESLKNKKIKFLQTEDETSAGFATIGSILGGEKAFTATAGPGTVLMQDPLSMAENQRLPFVGIIMQRGGPSTGTVSYSQQEVNLSAFGGNGDGLRIVYSASNVSEMYSLTAKAFSTAWKYRFPTLVLGDGHLAKTRTVARLTPPINPIKSEPILAEKATSTHLRNCYSTEEMFGKLLLENIEAWEKIKKNVVEFETYKTLGASELVIAHGTVADTAKDAVDILRSSGKKIGLFRPITIHPLPTAKLRKLLSSVHRAFVVESSLNQFSRMIKYEATGIDTPIKEISKPAESFTAEEMAEKISQSLIM